MSAAVSAPAKRGPPPRRTLYAHATLGTPEHPVHTDVLCPSLVQHTNSLGVEFRVLESTSEGHSNTSVHVCLNDGESFEGRSFPIVEDYDRTAGRFVLNTLTRFCSLACVRRYLIDRPTHTLSAQLLYLTKYARECCDGDLTTSEAIEQIAPPLLRLQKYGGDLSIEEYRKAQPPSFVREPPFITHLMVLEKHSGNTGDGNAHPWNIRGLRIPTTTAGEAASVVASTPPAGLLAEYVNGHPPPPTQQLSFQPTAAATPHTAATSRKRRRGACATQTAPQAPTTITSFTTIVSNTAIASTTSCTTSVNSGAAAVVPPPPPPPLPIRRASQPFTNHHRKRMGGSVPIIPPSRIGTLTQFLRRR